MTFARAVQSLTAIAARCGMFPGTLATLKAAINQAGAAARLGDTRPIVMLIRALQSDVYTGPTMLDAISKEDLLALLNRLSKRVNMSRAGLLTPAEL